MNEPLQGKIALVTGGSRGIGAAITKRLAAEGATVAFSYARRADDAERSAAVLRGQGSQAQAFQADQAGTASCEQLVTSVVGASGFGRMWPLVKPGGAAILFGGAAGYPTVDPAELASRGVRLAQPSTPQYVNTPELVTASATAVFDALRDGVFGTVTPAIYPLADTHVAHADLGARATTGSVLLIP